MQLSSERMVFRHFRENDFDNYFRLYGNAEVMEMITGRPLTEEEARKRFLYVQETNRQQPEIGWFAIYSIENHDFMGLGKIVMTDTNEAEIGYCLLPEYWGKGLASEISARLTEHAASIPGIHSLIAIIDPENTASKRILEKGNFTLHEVCDYDGMPAEVYKLNFP